MGLLDIFLHCIDNGYVMTITLVSTAIILYLVKIFQFYSGTPPGPWGVPILGYLPFLNVKEAVVDFVRISKKYGDVFSIKIGSRYVVVFNGLDVIRDASLTYAFDGRPQDLSITEFGDNKNVAVTDGHLWRQQRIFLLRALRDFGSGKSPVEEYIYKEAEITVEKFRQISGKEEDITLMMKQVTCNVIACVIFGRRFLDHEPITETLLNITNVLDEANPLTLNNSFPSLQKIQNYLPKWLVGKNPIKEDGLMIYDFVDKIIDEHKKSFDENNLRDLIDCYLSKDQENMDGENIIFSRGYMRANIVGLFAAGVDTTAIVLCSALKVLAAYPNVQKAVQAELDEVIGRERHPAYKERRLLPYTEATIQELQRYISLATMTAFHRATDEVIFNGYRIPKNSSLLFNLWSINRSPDLWEDPDQFNPQRFLDKDGKLTKNFDNMIPFLIGKRSCLGEIIARMEVFLFITIFLQHYSFTLPKGEVWKYDPDMYLPMAKFHKNFVCATPRT